MTIEKTIQDLTAAVLGLTGAILNQRRDVGALTDVEFTEAAELLKKDISENPQNYKRIVTDPKTGKKEVLEPKTTDAEIVVEPAVVKPKKPAAPKAEAKTAEVTYDTVKQKTLDLVAKDRPTAIKLLIKFIPPLKTGDKPNATQIPLEKYGEYVAEVNKLLGE